MVSSESLVRVSRTCDSTFRLPDVSLLINKTAFKKNTPHSLRGFISYANNNCLTELQNTELFTKLLYTWTVITINVLFNGVLF